jgi:uncharacterized membrane protein YccC
MARISKVHRREAFKLAPGMALFSWIALWMNRDMPRCGVLAIALVSLGTTGASLLKGVLRLVGTTGGLAVRLVIIGYFMQASRYAAVRCLETSAGIISTR